MDQPVLTTPTFHGNRLSTMAEASRMSVLLFLFDELFEEYDDAQRTSLQDFIAKLMLLVPTARQWKPRITGYVEEVVSLYSDSEFRSMFRINRSVADLLVKLLNKSKSIRQFKEPRGRDPIDMLKQVLLLVFYLGTQNTERQISDKFGISDSSVNRCLSNSMSWLVEDYGSLFINWPKGSAVAPIVEGFKNKRGIDGVIGAIDGSHVPITHPQEQAADYVNRKGFYSVILQAVCDHNLSFTDIYVGWPGSVHDARVLSNSPLGTVLEQDPDCVCANGLFLLGDAAYPLAQTLLTPFKDNGRLTREQSYYNFCHSSTRMSIERAFGLLKGRFRRLKMVDVASVSKVVTVVSAACIIHNMCLISEEKVLYEDFVHEGQEEEVNDYVSIHHGAIDGKQKRSDVMRSIYEHGHST